MITKRSKAELHRLGSTPGVTVTYDSEEQTDIRQIVLEIVKQEIEKAKVEWRI